MNLDCTSLRDLSFLSRFAGSVVGMTLRRSSRQLMSNMQVRLRPLSTLTAAPRIHI
jgi:hypothetical protein